MKKLSLLLLAFVCVFAVNAQDESAKPEKNWKVNGNVSLNFSQTTFTNWAEGGEDNITLAAIGNLFANYTKDRLKWENALLLEYGMQKIGDGDFVKNIDKIDFLSKAGYQTSEGSKIYYSYLFNFKSQMTPTKIGDSTLVSKFLAPAYIITGPGIDYKPMDNFSVYLSPASAKITIVNNEDLADAGSFGVDPAMYDAMGVKIEDGKKTRLELGANLVMLYNTSFFNDRIKYNTKLELYSNYLDRPDHIDINWLNNVSLSVLSVKDISQKKDDGTFGKRDILTVNFGLELRYDHDIEVGVDRDDDGMIDGTGPRTQLKQLFAVGLGYNF